MADQYQVKWEQFLGKFLIQLFSLIKVPEAKREIKTDAL